MQTEDAELDRARLLRLQNPEGVYRAVYVCSAVFTVEECCSVLTAVLAYTDTEQHGWTTGRHAGYPTTDVPAHVVTAIAPWVRATLQQRLLPCVTALYGLPLASLTLRDLFFVKVILYIYIILNFFSGNVGGFL